MKVKIKGEIYDSKKEPIMIILSNEEKWLIKHMIDENHKFCSYPDGEDASNIKKFMETRI